MIFWIDAQLPPSLAEWLITEFAVEAHSLRSLDLRDAEDIDIFHAAKSINNTVIISKDSDFIELVLRHHIPPQLLWVTCGNLTNSRLREIFIKVFPRALDLLGSGEMIVEIGDESAS